MGRSHRSNKNNKKTKQNKNYHRPVSIRRPKGYGPFTLPLRHGDVRAQIRRTCGITNGCRAHKRFGALILGVLCIDIVASCSWREQEDGYVDGWLIRPCRLSRWLAVVKRYHLTFFGSCSGLQQVRSTQDAIVFKVKKWVLQIRQMSKSDRSPGSSLLLPVLLSG